MPLPAWIYDGMHGTLRSADQIQLLADDMVHRVENVGSSNDLLDEMCKRIHYAPRGRPIYSTEMIRLALLLRHTSLQAYRLLTGRFPLPSVSLLRKLQQGGVDSVQAIVRLR